MRTSWDRSTNQAHDLKTKPESNTMTPDPEAHALQLLAQDPDIDITTYSIALIQAHHDLTNTPGILDTITITTRLMAPPTEGNPPAFRGVEGRAIEKAF